MFRYSTEDALVNRMENLKFLDETTNTTYALHLARTQLFGSEDRGDRPNVPNVAIILTDGKPTGDVATAAKAARELRDSGVRIISIGVTREISEELLMNMSSAPRVKDQDYFTSPDFDKLNSLLLGIINSACLAPSTTPPPDLSELPSDVTFNSRPRYRSLALNNCFILLFYTKLRIACIQKLSNIIP